MENSRQYGRRGVNMGNIIGDPFALATISISAVSLSTHLSPHALGPLAPPSPCPSHPFPPPPNLDGHF